jgi:hypothetical protein
MKRILLIVAGAVAVLTIIFFFLNYLFSSHSTVVNSEPYEVTQARAQATIAQLSRDQHSADFWLSFGQALAITAVITLFGIVVYVSYQFHLAATHRREMERARLKRYGANDQGNFDQYFDADTGISFTPPPGNYIQPVPQHYSFAPHYSPPGRGIEGPAGAVAQLAAPPPAVPIAAPSFNELYRRGDVGHSDTKMLLGISPAGELVTGTWLDLYSSGIAGVSGSGKTTTVRFLTIQAALLGARFIIVDPERDSGLDDSLATTLAPLDSRFMCQPASEDDEVINALSLASGELKRRRASSTGNRYPLIVAVDELTTLMRNQKIKEQLSELLQDIAQGGRKHGIYAMCMGQIWLGRTSGGTELRDSFASFYVHRLKPKQAQLLLPSDEAREAVRFDKGQAFLAKTGGDIIPVNIPLTTGEDVIKIAGLIAGSKPRALTGSYPEVNRDLTGFEAKAPAPGDMQIMQMFNQGKDVADIVRELHGDVKGATYQRRAEEVQAAIRRVTGQS